MKMAWRIVFILVACVASFSDGDKLFPKPSLTENRSARVLKLECKPPDDTSSWQDVHDIRVFVCLRAPHFDECVNHTVASMTSAMTTSRRGSVLPSIAKVTFSGSWTPAGSPTLTVQTPFSSENYGVYFCTSEYSSSDGIRKYSAGVKVDYSSDTRRSPLTRDRFEVQILKAHEVNVTWRPPDDSEFLEGRVTRSFVDREGKVMTSPRTLFTATRDFVYDSAGVLLTQFLTPSTTGQTYSMSVYVDSQMCTPFCRYSCSVPYHACVGPDAHFCECSHGENVASTTASTESLEKSVTATTESVYYSVTTSTGLSVGDTAAISLAVFIFACFVAVIVLILLLRRKKLPGLRNWLGCPVHDREVATNEQNTVAHTKPENELLIAKKDHTQSSKSNGQPNDQPKSAGGAEAPDIRVENEQDTADLDRIASVRGPETQPTSLGTLDRPDGPEGPVDEGTSRLSKQYGGHRPSSGQASVAIAAPTSTVSPQRGSAAVGQATLHASPSAGWDQAGRQNEDLTQSDGENNDHSINSLGNMSVRINLQSPQRSKSASTV